MQDDEVEGIELGQVHPDWEIYVEEAGAILHDATTDADHEVAYRGRHDGVLVLVYVYEYGDYVGCLPHGVEQAGRCE